MLAAMENGRMLPWDWRSSGTSAMSAAPTHRAAIGALRAEQHLRELGAARAHQAVDAEDFPAPQRETDVFEFAGAAELLDAQQFVADVRRLLREQLFDRPAHHQPDQLVAMRRAQFARAHRCAVAEHRVTVGQLENLLELDG